MAEYLTQLNTKKNLTIAFWIRKKKLFKIYI